MVPWVGEGGFCYAHLADKKTEVQWGLAIPPTAPQLLVEEQWMSPSRQPRGPCLEPLSITKLWAALDVHQWQQSCLDPQWLPVPSDYVSLSLVWKQKREMTVWEFLKKGESKGLPKKFLSLAQGSRSWRGSRLWASFLHVPECQTSWSLGDILHRPREVWVTSSGRILHTFSTVLFIDMFIFN